MARKIICDACQHEVTSASRVRVRDGDHPHNGSTMYDNVDICNTCIQKIPGLESHVEKCNLRQIVES